MTGIWEFPELEELEDFIEDGVETAKEEAVDNGDLTEFNADRLVLEKILVTGDWGMGRAEVGESPLEVLLIFDMEGAPTPHIDPAFDPSARVVLTTMQSLITSGEIEPTELMKGSINGIDTTHAAISRLEENILKALGKGEGNSIYDMSAGVRIEFSEGVREVRSLPKTPLEILRQQAEEEDEEPEDEEEPEEEDEPPEPPEPPEVPQEGPDEEEEDPFPDVPEELHQFAISNEQLEIPSGKETLKIDPREPHDFEVEMAKPGVNVDPSVNAGILGEIGRSVAVGKFGQADSPGTFPRTGKYVRNYLKYQGDSYAYEMYKNLVYYSGYISTVHGGSFKTGSYQAFRDFMYVLRQFSERDDLPTLVQPLGQNQASSRGLSTVPDHPTVEGEKAPWLERRQFYTLVEENEDNEAWMNVYDTFYGDDE